MFFFSASCTASIETVMKCIIVIMCVDEFEWKRVEISDFEILSPGANPKFHVIWYVLICVVSML